ncbi:Uncharacterized protein Fot_04594 [Forsythia ovata]|uniref:Uncharacterized protein n=1 Tax=Forsythia ovata TaxID=205694 RepID=A0ABD1XDU6_9LAMI
MLSNKQQCRNLVQRISYPDDWHDGNGAHRVPVMPMGATGIDTGNYFGGGAPGSLQPITSSSVIILFGEYSTNPMTGTDKNGARHQAPLMPMGANGIDVVNYFGVGVTVKKIEGHDKTEQYQNKMPSPLTVGYNQKCHKLVDRIPNCPND